MKPQCLLKNYGGDILALSLELISKFAKIAVPEKEKKKEATVYAYVQNVYDNGTADITIDGSNGLSTPASYTSDVKTGDRVTALVKNHSVIITGNVTSPSTSKGTFDSKFGSLDEDMLTNSENIEKANEDISNLQKELDNLKSSLGSDPITATNIDEWYGETVIPDAEGFKMISELEAPEYDLTPLNLELQIQTCEKVE